ncbi:MAG TPA: EutN/CcmL family microcompartment protein [Devosiaceae bacterium]|nr:EutN/CcmL family microcompartment protein [Devosiaceae bacterium]
MVLGRVVGKGISTVKHKSLGGIRMLLVEPIQAASLDPVLALDTLGAGSGDLVIMSSDGIYTRELVNDDTSPARWTIIGIADDATSVMEQLEWPDRS